MKLSFIFSYDLDPDPMTLITKLDLDMVKTYLHTKNEVFYVKGFKSYSLNIQQTDMTENITYSHTRVVIMLVATRRL